MAKNIKRFLSKTIENPFESSIKSFISISYGRWQWIVFLSPEKKNERKTKFVFGYVEAFKHVFGCFHIKQSKTDLNILHLLIENVYFFFACFLGWSLLVIQFYIHRFEDPWNEFHPKNLNFRYEIGSCCECVPNTNSNCIAGNWTRVVQMSEMFRSLHHHHTNLQKMREKHGNIIWRNFEWEKLLRKINLQSEMWGICLDNWKSSF